MTRRMQSTLLSIVITSYTLERVKYIYELLESIKAQTYRDIETIFIAEGRELYEQVKAYGEREAIPNLKVLFNDDEQGASAARNLGIKQSKGEIIAFIDDDAIAFPDWAEHAVRTFEDDGIIGVTGPAIPHWEDKSSAWFPEELHWVISCTSWCDLKSVTEVRNVWLENACFRREAFEQVGLIDTNLGPCDSLHGFKGREFTKKVISEEVELSLRVRKATGKRIVYNPGVRVRHRVRSDRLKLGYIARWSYWMGFSKHRLKQLYPAQGERLLGQESNLLKRIIARLLPRILIGFFREPATSWRKLTATFTVLTFVLLGYLSTFRLQPKRRDQSGAETNMVTWKF